VIENMYKFKDISPSPIRNTYYIFIPSSTTMKTSPSLLVLLSSFLLSSATLLVDYHGGDAASVLGNVELEGQELGCKIINGQAGNACFIKPEVDSATGKPSLHFKRDPHFRRAEVKALYTSANKAVVDKTYYIGYNFRLSKAYESLVIFQWWVNIPRQEVMACALTSIQEKMG
jgi:hypothetical protein